MRAVEGDGHPVEIEGKAAAQELDVVGLRPIVGHQTPDVLAPGARGDVLGRPGAASISASQASGNFAPLAVRSLMPLSSKGLCDAVKATPPWASQRARQQRDARRGQHAHRVAVRAGRERARGERRLQERPRAPRVAPEHQAHALRAVLGLQRRHQLPADPIRQLRRQGLLVGHPADAVRPEQSRHARASAPARVPGASPVADRASATRTASSVSRTSCVRISEAPWATARAVAASEPASRSPGDARPVTAPRKDLRDTATQRGRPDRAGARDPARIATSHSTQETGPPRKKPIPGSRTIRCVGDPGRARPRQGAAQARRHRGQRSRRERLSGRRRGHGDQSRAGLGHQSSELRIGETRDVVDHARARRERRPGGGDASGVRRHRDLERAREHLDGPRAAARPPRAHRWRWADRAPSSGPRRR